MKSLYLRVWLTIVALLALFALVASMLFRQEVVRERGRVDALSAERAAAWAELIERTLPPADAAVDVQAQAVRDWSQRLGMPLALDDAQGKRLVESESFNRRAAHARRDDDADRGGPRTARIPLDDGRSLWIMGARPNMGPRVARLPEGGSPMSPAMRMWPWPQGFGLIALLALLFVGVAAGAYPVVRRLTRRLEALERGVEGFGSGDLTRRVDIDGKDEVASVALAFNRAADRVESLLRSNQSLLANASHELRSPLARMKMAVSMLEDGQPAARRQQLEREIHTNIAELDALVDEVLLASRLDAQAALDRNDRVDLRSMLVEEAARADANVTDTTVEMAARTAHTTGNTTAGAPLSMLMVRGDERLLRRAVRNLLENARRYGGGSVDASLTRESTQAVLRVADRGPGVPADMRERIFEPFFRLPGHAEREGGVGLGLALVRQIAQRHGGSVGVQPRDGGGSVFVLRLPAQD